MAEVKFPELITPEIIETLSQNAENLKQILNFENGNVVTGGSVTLSGNDDHPKIFIGCDVKIINKNAACEGECSPKDDQDISPDHNGFTKRRVLLTYHNGLASTMIIKK